ncbi:MAG: GIY-YIG nuclease family protein [Kiritimatiellales bacterium]|nr:GIY-YIG nuclease family protein [Kiritimatiellota bacterium]MBL7011412.1 GIY-YIG nuclease family protein [Kiritimatiellales bacterium]
MTYYVYILKSDQGEHRYVGQTSEIKARLKDHNAGRCPHTAKFRPWQVETAVAFQSEEKAHAFERYLKSGSGREFARLHF